MARYNADELKQAAQTLGCYAWDVVGVFYRKQVGDMTRAEFEAALKEWRTPQPVSKSQPGQGRARQSSPRPQPRATRVGGGF
jgi:hypothetical protein